MEEKTVRLWQKVVVDVALTAAGLASAALGVAAIWNSNPGLAATGLAGGLVLLFAATIDRFELIKGFGIEAKTREIKDQVDKAERALSQLRDLAEFTGTNLLRMVSAGGRHGSATSMDNSYKVSREVKKLFADASSKPDTVRTALEFWARYAALDLFVVKVRAFETAVQERAQQLGQDATKLQGAECEDLMRHAHELSAYIGPVYQGLSKMELHEFPSRLRNLLENAPHLLPAQKEHWKTDFDPAIKQLQYLADNLDYEDHEYWSEISRKRG